MARHRRSIGKARARHAFELAAAELGIGKPDIGRIRKLGEGASSKAFTAELDSEVDGSPMDLVALIPSHRSPAPGPRDPKREARLLQFLARQELAFEVSRHAIAVVQDGDSILVCERVFGMPVDLRAGRLQSIVPWEAIAEVAASLHRLPIDELGWLGSNRSCRDHGEQVVHEVADLESCDEPSVRDAIAWMRDHLPAERPACLLHGDLLGQNILWTPMEPFAVVDWERATIGDPAYELAIVTGGVKKPFQVAGGLKRLLHAYNERAEVELQEVDVRFHEIGVQLGQYRSSIGREAGAEWADQVLGRLRNLMRAAR